MPTPACRGAVNGRVAKAAAVYSVEPVLENSRVLFLEVVPSGCRLANVAYFEAFCHSLTWRGVFRLLAPAAAGSPRNVVHPADATTSATSPRPVKSRSVKVMGMDAYDYCELLRSSSL